MKAVVNTRSQREREQGIKSSYDSNLEALTNPETGLRSVISKIMQRIEPFRDAFMQRIGITMDFYQNLSDVEKRKVNEQWRNSKEYKELQEL